jgi:hypothetical protein
VIGLTLGTSHDLGFAQRDDTSPVRPDLIHYEPVRKLLLNVIEECDGLPLAALERGLYRLTHRVPNDPRQTWGGYQDALLAAAIEPAPPIEKTDEGDADDEQDKLPSAP